MRSGATRPALTALLTGLLCLLLSWQLTTAATGASGGGPPPIPPPQAHLEEAGAVRSPEEPGVQPASESFSLPVARPVSVASQPVPPSPPHVHFSSGLEFSTQVTSASTSASQPQSEPPYDTEPPEDGLPPSALNCPIGKDGGFQCGGCRTDGDCPPGQGCVIHRRTRGLECMASECEEDAHCFPGFLCRGVTTGAERPVIRRCLPAGTQRLGEWCNSMPVSRRDSCQEGLRCVESVCTRPCRLEAPDCPEGHVCEEDMDGPGCRADCRLLGCPGSQRCAHVLNGDYACLDSVQGDCQERGCPEGQFCNMRMWKGKAVFWCSALCQPFLPESCPQGQVCGRGSPSVSACFQACDPNELESCGEGHACFTVSEDMRVWGCLPDLD